MPDQFVSLLEVERLTTLHKSQLYAMMNAGGFPRGYRLTTRRRAWRHSEILAWIESRERVALAGYGHCSPCKSRSAQ